MSDSVPKRRILKIKDFDSIFERLPKDKIIILNQFDFSHPRYSEILQEHIYSREFEIDFVARCQCEHLVGNFWEGSICPRCKTEVNTDMEASKGSLDLKLWVSCPDDVPGWLNPAIYRILAKWLSTSKRVKRSKNSLAYLSSKTKTIKYNYLDDILDVTSENREEFADAITGKGFTYFYENFDYIIDFFAHRFSKTKDKPNTPSILYLLQQYRHLVFCRYIPIASSALHSIWMDEGQSDRRKKYVEQSSQSIMLVASTLATLKFTSSRRKRLVEIEESVFTAYKELINYDEDIAHRQLSRKKSIPRMHIFGSRLHFSFRSVIVPITGPHALDELHLPWKLTVNLLRPLIVGRLVREGYSGAEAFRIQQTALQKYDERIHRIINAFIDECVYKGLAINFNRNPTIRAGSEQLLFATKVKTNIADESIGMSTGIVTPYNADFDGDEMNGFLILETEAVKAFMALHPSRNYLSRNELKINGMYHVPKLLLISANTSLGMI